MAKKNNSNSKAYSKKGGAKNKKYVKKKGLSKKAWLGIFVLVIAVSLSVILPICTSTPSIDIDAAEISLKNAGYVVNDQISKQVSYTGIVKTLSGTYVNSTSDSLSDYVNANVDEINFICFDTEENAEIAFEDFSTKYQNDYEECGISGSIIYYGTSNALDSSIG